MGEEVGFLNREESLHIDKSGIVARLEFHRINPTFHGSGKKTIASIQGGLMNQ